MIVHPHQPRVRVEWVLALARAAMASAALIAVAVTPAYPARALLAYLAAWYLIYSLGMIALVWAPARFASGWDYAVHAFDLGVFAVVMVVSAAAVGPFAGGVLFLLVAGMIRWQLAGVFWSVVGALGAFGIADAYAAQVLQLPAFSREILLSDGVVLAVETTLMALLAVYQRRYQLEVGRLATWPRTLEQDPRGVLAEIIERSGELIDAPRIVLVWRDPEEGEVNLARRSGGEIEWVNEPRGAFGSLVEQDLIDRSFQARECTSDRGRVVVLTERGFRRSRRRTVDGELCARFDMHVVQSSPLSGELIQGRIFFLDQPRQRLDDLILGDVVARLAAVRLDSFYVLRQLGDSAALKERVRVSRDLHDSLLQSQAGAALQLMAARRLLETDPAAARQSLDAIQQQLERGELEMRAFIRGLRPHAMPALSPPTTLRDRLGELQRHLERRWSIGISVALDPSVDNVPGKLTEQVYRLVQEGVVNAARHAAASEVRVHLSQTAPDVLRVHIVDDGKGFPFRGTFDLAELGRMREGPLTLRERVAELNGDLTLTSSTAGTELLITLPQANA